MPFAALGWEVLIIPAIGFIVWLVSMLFRNATDAPKKNVPRPVREADEPRRQTSSDLDRFISDTRRQREATERRGPRPGQPPRPQRRPVILEEVVEEPRPRPVARPRPIPQRPVPSQVPAARPVVVPVLEVVETVSSAPVMQSLTQNVLPTMPQQPTAPVDMLKRDDEIVSPLLLDIKQMLKTPQSAQLAFALREIFDQPLSRRGRR